MLKILILFLLLFSKSTLSQGYDVFGFGIYDVKLDTDQTVESAADFRYERRFDYSLLEIGPEKDNFFNLKPFLGIEKTTADRKSVV